MILQQLIAVDQLLNTLIPGGMADETLSARAFRCELKGDMHWSTFRRAVDTLFFWQPNHCYQAWRHEIERAQLPSEYHLNLAV